MTHISKRELPAQQRQKLFRQFVKLFAVADERDTNVLFTIVCTETEQIMLIKRVAAILMVDKGLSTYAISKSLMISDSTVRVVKSKYQSGEYHSLLRVIHKKQFDSIQLLKTLETLLRFGMPEQGKNRWRFLDQQ